MSALEATIEFPSTGFSIRPREKLEGILALLRAQTIASGTSGVSVPADIDLPLLADVSVTSVWVWQPALAQSAPDLLDEIKNESGLTWDQIGRIMGVSRRSVHLWLNGRPPSADKEERLHAVVHVLRTVTTRSQAETRSRLLDKTGGTSVFELLVSGHDDDALEVGRSRAASDHTASLFTHSPPLLTSDARTARRSSLNALDLIEVGASQETTVSPARLKRARLMKRRTDEH